MDNLINFRRRRENRQTQQWVNLQVGKAAF